jgi:hypothetical protein
MRQSDTPRYGPTLALSLILSWTLATGLIAASFLAGERTPESAALWAGLWFFTIAAPTIQAFRIHRCLVELTRDCPTVATTVTRDLAHARFVVLMCGSMTVLIAFALRASR